MARGIRNICTHCATSIKAWSDGNPYFIDESGTKEYAYHPEHERLEKCIGNDSPYLCLNCGEQFMVDSRAPVSECPKCGAKDISDTYELDKKRCPFCKVGTFTLDADFCVTS